MSATTHTLARAVVHGTLIFSSVPIQQLTHADRRQAAKSSSKEGDQDDFLLHRLTGMPLEAIALLSFRDYRDLVDQFRLQAFDGEPRAEGTKTVLACFEYSLRQPLRLADGTTRDTLRLRELTRGDQKAAAQYSADDFDAEEFLIARMAGLAIEDLAGLHIGDSYELPRFFRRVVYGGSAASAAGPSADAADAADVVGNSAPATV